MHHDKTTSGIYTQSHHQNQNHKSNILKVLNASTCCRPMQARQPTQLNRNRLRAGPNSFHDLLFVTQIPRTGKRRLTVGFNSYRALGGVLGRCINNQHNVAVIVIRSPWAESFQLCQPKYQGCGCVAVYNQLLGIEINRKQAKLLNKCCFNKLPCRNPELSRQARSPSVLQPKDPKASGV